MSFSISSDLASQIAAAVKDVCGHDINFIDNRGIIFASTNKNRVGNYHEIGHQVAKTGETIEVETDDSFQGTYKGVNIPFIVQGEVAAVIGISGIPDHVRKYAYLAQKITNLILREYELEKLEQTQKVQLHQLVRALVHNEYLNPDYLSDMLKKYGIRQDREYCTVIVKLNARYNPSNLSLIENAIYQVFQQTGSGLYTFHFTHEYILILEAAKLRQWMYLFERLAEKYSPILKIGIGSSEALQKQHYSYQNAELSVNSLLGEEYIAVYEKLNLELLLGNISDNAKSRFICKNLEHLDENDKDLLKEYFSTDMSLKETCQKLYMHKNTLQYKLDRIYKLSGCNPRNFRDAVILYLALKLENGVH